MHMVDISGVRVVTSPEPFAPEAFAHTLLRRMGDTTSQLDIVRGRSSRDRGCNGTVLAFLTEKNQCETRQFG